MKQKIKRIIRIVFGTQDNIFAKLNCSFLVSGILFFAFSFLSKEQNNFEASNIFSYISGGLLGMWLAFVNYNDSISEIIKELFRLFVFYIVLIYSLNFCINSSIRLHGFNLITGSILSCFGIIFCSFYLISRFIDIFIFIKKIFNKIKQKLFNSAQPATSKIKASIENITAFLVAIAGLGVAIKAIIEPLINLFK